MNPENRVSLFYAFVLVLVALLSFNITDTCDHSGINGRCSWENWESWSECSCKCGTSGTKERTRYADVPPACPFGCHPNEDTETESCTIACDHGGTAVSCGICDNCNADYYGDCCETGNIFSDVICLKVCACVCVRVHMSDIHVDVCAYTYICVMNYR